MTWDEFLAWNRFRVLNGKLNWLMLQADVVNRKVDRIMGQNEDLKAAVAGIGTSIDNEIARVEAVIANLTSGGADPAVVAQAIADLKASTAKLDGERPAV